MRKPRSSQKVASEPPRAVPRERKHLTRDPAYEVALGARIRSARIGARMSQYALGAALGVSYQQVQKYESGRDRVAVSTLHGIATTLGIHPGWFFDENVPVLSESVSDVKRVLKFVDVLGQIRNPRVLNRLLALAEALAGAYDKQADRPSPSPAIDGAEP